MTAAAGAGAEDGLRMLEERAEAEFVVASVVLQIFARQIDRQAE